MNFICFNISCFYVGTEFSKLFNDPPKIVTDSSLKRSTGDETVVFSGMVTEMTGLQFFKVSSPPNSWFNLTVRKKYTI